MRKVLALTLFAALALTSCGKKVEEAAPLAAVAPPAGKQWTDVVAQTAEGYRLGNPDAPLKLVEYGSRTCPTCGEFGRQGMRPLEEKYVKTGKLSYEFRDFIVHGAPDVPASQLGRCIGAETFFPVLEQMYMNQIAYLEPMEAGMSDQAFQASLTGKPAAVIATAWAEKMGLIDFFKQRGLPEAAARACLNDTKALEKLAKITNDASASGLVTGTPTFILNDKKLENVVSWAALEPALKSAGAR